MYLPNSSTQEGSDTRSILTGLNSEFSFSETSCYTKVVDQLPCKG